MRQQDAWSGYAKTWADRYDGYDLRRTEGGARVWHRLGYRVGQSLVRLRIHPAGASLLGLGISIMVPVLVRRGPGGLLLAAAAVVLSAFVATAAAAVAVLTTGRSRLGVIWESVALRLSEVSWLVAFQLAGVPTALMLACGVAIGLHEYFRTQALAAGISRVGVQTASDRALRVPVAAGGLFLAGLAGLASTPLVAGTLTVLAGLWLVLTLLGFFQLIEVVHRALR